MEQPSLHPNPAPDRDLERLRRLADLLDNRFRIPGTNIRFGLDGIIGLVPGIGDLAGLAVSGFLMFIMARRGAGPLIMVRMAWNSVIDALVGEIPILGDLFDFRFKANRRNVDMLLKYYENNDPKPRAGFSLLLLALFMITLLGLAIWGILRLFLLIPKLF